MLDRRVRGAAPTACAVGRGRRCVLGLVTVCAFLVRS